MAGWGGSMEWDGMRWDRTGSDSMEWDGIGWDRTGCYTIGWDGTACNRIGYIHFCVSERF